MGEKVKVKHRPVLAVCPVCPGGGGYFYCSYGDEADLTCEICGRQLEIVIDEKEREETIEVEPFDIPKI